MKKAYGYLRVSGLSQVDRHGFDRQLEAIRGYAAKHGYEISRVFREEGISGTTDETNRPSFQAMMAEILKDGVQTVIIESLDRLARDLLIQQSLLAYLTSKDVTLIAASTGENITESIGSDPMRRALAQIQGTFSELEKNLLVRKLKTAREKVRLEKGKCEGGPAYGETEEEQAVIKRVRMVRRKKKGGHKGMTLKQIADSLNRDGIKAKWGGEWNPSQIHRILNRKL